MIKLEDAKTKHFNWKFKQMLKSHKETCVHRNIGITVGAGTWGDMGAKSIGKVCIPELKWW